MPNGLSVPEGEAKRIVFIFDKGRFVFYPHNAKFKAYGNQSSYDDDNIYLKHLK